MDPETGEWRIRSDPEYIQQAIDRSLRRLGLPCVDLYYCRRLDPEAPIETTAAETKKLRQGAGEARHLGLSERAQRRVAAPSRSAARAGSRTSTHAVQAEHSAPFSLDVELAGGGPPARAPRAGASRPLASVAYAPLWRGFQLNGRGEVRSRAGFEEKGGGVEWTSGSGRRGSRRRTPAGTSSWSTTLRAVARGKGCAAGGAARARVADGAGART